MTSRARWRWALVLAAVTIAGIWTATVPAAEPPAAPKVSTFAPAKDLEKQVGFHLSRLDEVVKSEDDYKGSEDRIAKDANTLILIALALGLSDEENAYKQSAPGLIKAAQELAKVKDYAAAKAGVEQVKKAATSGAAPGKLGWAKIASLPELMKQVPLVNSRLKRNVTSKNFKRRAEQNAGDSAALAVIAQGSMADTTEVKKPGDETKWYTFCEEMRKASADLNAAVHAGKEADADKAMTALNKTCDDCHEMFHPPAKAKMNVPAAKAAAAK
jgi:cytochrome c556